MSTSTSNTDVGPNDPMRPDMTKGPLSKLIYDTEGKARFVQLNPLEHSPSTTPFDATTPVYFLDSSSLSSPDHALLSHQLSVSKVPAVYCRLLSQSDASMKVHTLLIDDTPQVREHVSQLSVLLNTDDSVAEYKVSDSYY